MESSLGTADLPLPSEVWFIALRVAACHLQLGDAAMMADGLAQVDALFDEVVRARESVRNMTLREDCHDFEVADRHSCGII